MPTAFKYRNPTRKEYGPAFPWTDEQITTLRERWAAGDSASVIASRLGTVSRCAVIGKARRLALPSRKPTTRIPHPPRFKPPRPVAAKPVKTKLVFSDKFKAAKPPAGRFALPPQQAADIARVQLLDLEPHHCRWPVGEPTQGFCGCSNLPGSPYCEAHAARAFTVDNRFNYAAKTPALGIRQFAATDEFRKQQEPVA